MSDAAIARSNSAMALLRLLRPLDWSKNSFVFAGLVFAHRWNDTSTVIQVALGFAGFSLVASAVYAFNDIFDRQRDAQHPVKKNRPLAAGVITPTAAATIGGLCLATGIVLGVVASPTVAVLLGLYALINVAYTLRIKHIVILDVFVIATGFVLRILVGTIGVDIPPSSWILLCGFTLALFLGFSKRRVELALDTDVVTEHRAVLGAYSASTLDHMIGITAACAILSYSLYTIDDATRTTHGTESLIATVPFVIYGILRYLYGVQRGTLGGSPARDSLRDPHVWFAVIGWIVVTAWLVN